MTTVTLESLDERLGTLFRDVELHKTELSSLRSDVVYTKKMLEKIYTLLVKISKYGATIFGFFEGLRLLGG